LDILNEELQEFPMRIQSSRTARVLPARSAFRGTGARFDWISLRSKDGEWAESWNRRAAPCEMVRMGAGMLVAVYAGT